jgi:glycosyltransferase involved in cell wall biosynthesis
LIVALSHPDRRATWAGEKGALLRCLEEISPTQLVLRYPSIEILRWAQPRAMPVLVTFADSFTYRLGLRGLVDRWRFHQLAALLNRPFVSFVGNHNLGASRSLARIGVEPHKIIPWDWPRSPTPADYPAKWQPKQSGKKLICVGQVNEAKGVGDVLRALASPQLRNMNVSLDVLGDGDIREMNALAAELRVSDRVHFAGKVPYEQVAPAMHNADAVIVYSQHGYAEGLPGSIYVGLASRTPIVLSDHPMFVSYFKSGVDAIIAPQRNPPALASEIARLFEDRALYRSLSEGSDNVFTRIVHPVTWEDVVERGLRLNSDDRTWLTERALPAWP